jgi:hypothetical protein
MDAPAYAPESVTGFTAAGANLVLFTTGVGNSYVSALAPTLKVSGNPETAAVWDGIPPYGASAGEPEPGRDGRADGYRRRGSSAHHVRPMGWSCFLAGRPALHAAPFAYE